MWGEDEEGRREYVYNWVGARTGKDRIFIEGEPDPNLQKSISEVRAANRDLKEWEEDMRLDIEEEPIFFCCGYCAKAFTTIVSLIGHLFSKRSYGDTRRFEIPCEVRMIKENIPRNVPKKYKKPTMEPWL